MIKKFISLGVLLIVLFGLSACPKEAGILEDAALEKRIRQDYFERLDNTYGNYKLKDVYIWGYYGTYGDNVAVIMAVHGINMPPAMIEYEIAGLTFWFNTGMEMLIWNNGGFKFLLNAYDEGFLTKEDVEAIYNYTKK